MLLGKEPFRFLDVQIKCYSIFCYLKQHYSIMEIEVIIISLEKPLFIGQTIYAAGMEQYLIKALKIAVLKVLLTTGDGTYNNSI